MKKVLDFILIGHLIDFISKLLSSKTNESLKRAVAFLFAITMIIAYFVTESVEIKKLLIYCFAVLISLLLALATAETIVSLFKKSD